MKDYRDPRTSNDPFAGEHPNTYKKNLIHDDLS